MDIAVIGGTAWFVGALGHILEGGSLRLTLIAETTATFMRQAPESGPLIAILSCSRSETELLPLVQWCRRHRSETRVVAKFAVLRPDFVRDSIQAGAWGCFSAEDAPEVVTSVLRSVEQGRVSFPFVDFSVLRDDPFERLTRREREVLEALVQGWSNLQISARLGISENTVKYHLRLIYDKLEVNNRAAAVARYLERAAI